MIKRYIFKRRIKYWLYRHPYSLSDNGLWPFGLKFYKWGLIFHYKTIADLHIEHSSKHH